MEEYRKQLEEKRIIEKIDDLLTALTAVQNPDVYAAAIGTLANVYLQLREDKRRQLLIEMGRFAEVFNTIKVIVEESAIKGGGDRYYLAKDKAENLLAAVREVREKVYNLGNL